MSAIERAFEKWYKEEGRKAVNMRVRDARTGQYVPSGEAKRRPSTTVREVIPPRKRWFGGL